MLVDTGEWTRTKEENASLKASNKRLVEQKNILETRFTRLAQDMFRHSIGLLKSLPLSDEQIDETIAHLMKKGGTKPKV